MNEERIGYGVAVVCVLWLALAVWLGVPLTLWQWLFHLF